MSYKDKFSDLKDVLFGTLFDPLQESGYKPVFRVLSQNSYADTELATKLLVDTLPRDLKMKVKSWWVRDDFATVAGDVGIESIGAAEGLGTGASTVVKQTVGSIKDSVKQSVTGTPASPDDRPLEGCMIDFSLHRQPYPFSHVIFQNPTVTNPRGDQLFGTDLLKVGFPIWIYAGYIDQSGNVVKHPFDPMPRNHIPLVFAGFIGAISQEITEGAGDRMQLQCVGYLWYLENFSLETEDILQIGMDTPIEVAIQRLFDEFYRSGGYSIPDIVKKAMRLKEKIAITEKLTTAVMIPGTEYLAITLNTFKPSVRYIYGSSKSMTPKKSNNKEGGFSSVILGIRGSSFKSIMQTIEWSYCVDIEWDVHGYLTVHGKADPYHRMVDKEGKVDERHIPRVHDAVIGGNIKNLDMSVSAEHVASGLRLTIHSPDTSHASETYVFTMSDIDRVLKDWEEEARKTKEPITDELTPTLIAGKKALVTDNDLFRLFGNKTFALDVIQFTTDHPTLGSDYLVLEEDVETSVDEPGVVEIEYANKKIIVPWPKEALQVLFRRLKYWGMRGSAMMIGNSNIREGDLLRITDVRPKGGILNVNLGAYRTVVSSIAEKVEEIRNDSAVSELYKGSRLGIIAFENVYFIWKIRHYVGPPGYWTKVWFVKQRDSLMSVGTLLKKLRGRKAPGDDTE